MKILHYALGFPPFRSGGLTKYCIDLMTNQAKLGHEITMVWPGEIKIFIKETKIVKRANYINSKYNFQSYEVINPLPVSLFFGINEISNFIRKTNEEVFRDFLKSKQIEVFHIHTLMGLPIEFIEAANQLNIRTIFTSHDYFGICPNGSLMKNSVICNDDHGCKDCYECNRNSISYKKLIFMQSRFYRFVKHMSIMKILRKHYKIKMNQDYLDKSADTDISLSSDIDGNKYVTLRNYYIQQLKMIDLYHFNSQNTKSIFGKYFDLDNKANVISITNNEIRNNKTDREYSDCVNFVYLGHIEVRKGFFLLVETLNKIYSSGKTNFKLHIYVIGNTKIPYIVEHEPYTYDNIDKVFNSSDMLILPSIWNETFGFTVLEALSFGVPVLVSSRVGAKDLVINEYSGYIYEDEDDLYNKLVKIIDNPKSILKSLNEYIVNNQEIKTMEMHTDEIIRLYKN